MTEIKYEQKIESYGEKQPKKQVSAPSFVWAK